MSIIFYRTTQMALTGLETTAIVLIVLLAWYIVMMVISIILHKFGHDTISRWVKAASLLNYPFKWLDKHSVHIEEEDKLGNRVSRFVANTALNAIAMSDSGKKAIEEYSSKPVKVIHETRYESLPEQPSTPPLEPAVEHVNDDDTY